MLNFHRERRYPMKKHLKALVFFTVSKQIPIVYSADRGRAENSVVRVTDRARNDLNVLKGCKTQIKPKPKLH